VWTFYSARYPSLTMRLPGGRVQFVAGLATVESGPLALALLARCEDDPDLTCVRRPDEGKASDVEDGRTGMQAALDGNASRKAKRALTAV
jgi:hypothetical protein